MHREFAGDYPYDNENVRLAAERVGAWSKRSARDLGQRGGAPMAST